MSQQQQQQPTGEDELTFEQTAGYKGPGARKTEDELAKLDYRDDSLKQWEQSLGLGGAANANAKPKVTVHQIAIDCPGRPTITLEVGKGNLVDNPITLKEGASFTVSLHFKVADAVVSGLQYIQVVKRLGFKSKDQAMVGSYGPSDAVQVKRFESEEAPSGMMSRGKYEVTSRVTDDDKHVHADFTWSFKIAKDWE